MNDRVAVSSSNSKDIYSICTDKLKKQKKKKQLTLDGTKRQRDPPLHPVKNNQELFIWSGKRFRFARVTETSGIFGHDPQRELIYANIKDIIWLVERVNILQK